MKLKTEIGSFGRIIRPRRTLEELDLSKTELDRMVELAQLLEVADNKLVKPAGKRQELPTGVAALFIGPSGSGKTMAAEGMAHRLNCPLLRIDLSLMVSKYIGETEKNLTRVFDAASQLGAVLLFDEADALFGKRSEVKDSHDRYANDDASYLLQRMEDFQGLVILTTNKRAQLDEAFVHRLKLVIEFKPSSTMK